MAVKNYYSVGGEILGEEVVGSGARLDYLTDALGSVTATVTNAGVIENTYRYKPYGETLAKTGTGSDPKFLWNGKSGYFTSLSKCYVRRRFFSSLLSRWYTVDPLGINSGDFNFYMYSINNPINYYDSSGLQYDKESPFNCVKCVSGQTPEDLCKQADKDLNNNLGSDAGLICYKGKKIPCPWHYIGEKSGCDYKCAKFHEEQHKQETPCPSNNSPYYGWLCRPPLNANTNKSREECDAYSKQFECLETCVKNKKEPLRIFTMHGFCRRTAGNDYCRKSGKTPPWEKKCKEWLKKPLPLK